MRKILFIVPFLFLGIKPYQQTINHTTKSDTLSPFQKDTIILSKVKSQIDMQLDVSEQLDRKKERLQTELKKVKKRERESRRKRREKRELEDFKKALEIYENRGI